MQVALGEPVALQVPAGGLLGLGREPAEAFVQQAAAEQLQYEKS